MGQALLLLQLIVILLASRGLAWLLRWIGQPPVIGEMIAGLALGSLMNAPGMVELIVPKIGLDAGVIGREMFTLLLMAIVTTMMTTPMLLYFTRQQQPVMGEVPH